MRTGSLPKRISGFSLIEVMIAVVVLAVGLLALVGLQTRLVREGADAKARSRVASLVSSRMDEARAVGYASLTPQAAAQCASGNDICQAESDAAIAAGSLRIGRQVTCSPAPHPTIAGACAPGTGGSEFKTVTITATWSGASGTSRSLSMTTSISPLSLDASSTLLNQPLSGGGSKTPIVRTSDPATDGVVPIALGNGSSSAASNPTPELVGQRSNQQVVGTRFNVLTYVPSGGAAVIQKRIETTAIKCTCQFGAGGTNLPLIYREAQWPAVWTGEKYELFQPTSSIAAPGESMNAGPKAGVTQSPLCQECCRDHHDGNRTGGAKFDPERSGDAIKYNLENASLVEVTNLTSGTYVNACRMIRVDGLWRTASDMYLRQYGLLETQSIAGVAAKSGLPSAASTAAYTSFVKGYLRQFTGSSTSAPGNGQTMFDGIPALQEPALIRIAKPLRSDYRYLHARGLYVDFLESKAREKIASVLADTGERGKCPAGTALEDCVMPYLPFTSANMTEIASWQSTNTNELVVNSGNMLATNPLEPSGGRAFAAKPSSGVDNVTRLRQSTSGIAVNQVLATLGGVDPVDDAQVSTDSQRFEIGGAASDATGDRFNVTISGGGANPFVFYAIDADTDECVMSSTGARPCVTWSKLPLAGSVRIENYGMEDTESRVPESYWGDGTCDSGGATRVSMKNNDNNFDRVAVPRYTNYRLSAATMNGVAGSIAQPLNDGKAWESTVVNFNSIVANGTVALTLTAETTKQYGLAMTCTKDARNGKVTILTWHKPWEH